jgi:hypothetical protein
MWLRDPKSKEKSVTLTVFIVGFVVATFKLLASGIVYKEMSMTVFTGVDYGAVVGALGAIYFARKNIKYKPYEKKEEVATPANETAKADYK